MSLSLQVYDPAGLASGFYVDWTSRVTGITFSTGKHGFEKLQGRLPAELTESLSLQDRLPGKHLVLGDGDVAFEGRIEDVTLGAAGLNFTALGYWRALSDVVYVGLWSDSSVSDNWSRGTRSRETTWFDERWELSNNEELYWSVREGERYGNNTHRGVWVYLAPNTGEAAQKINEIDYTYDYDLPTDWKVRFISHQEGFGSATTEHTYTSTGSNDTGTNTITLAADRPVLSISVYNSTGGAVDYASDTGTHYAKITAIRVKGSGSASIYGDEIADAMISHITTENATQLNAATLLVQSQALDIKDARYEDRTPADILTELASLGDDQTPPRVWETGVWENKTLHLQPIGDKARAWYADAATLDLRISLDEVVNEAYAKYTNLAGRVVRGAIDGETFSKTRYGITRRTPAPADTTDSTQAAAALAVLLDEKKLATPSGSFHLSHVYDGSGGTWPLWMVRGGDTITLRNLPPLGDDLVDKITRFRVSTTSYSVDGDSLTVTPDIESPRLARQLGLLI